MLRVPTIIWNSVLFLNVLKYCRSRTLVLLKSFHITQQIQLLCYIWYHLLLPFLIPSCCYPHESWRPPYCMGLSLGFCNLMHAVVCSIIWMISFECFSSENDPFWLLILLHQQRHYHSGNVHWVQYKWWQGCGYIRVVGPHNQCGDNKYGFMPAVQLMRQDDWLQHDFSQITDELWT